MAGSRNLNAVPLASLDGNQVAEEKDEKSGQREPTYGERFGLLLCGLLLLGAAGGTAYAFWYPAPVDMFHPPYAHKDDPGSVAGLFFGALTPIGFLICALCACTGALCAKKEVIRARRERKEPDVVVVEDGSNGPYAFVDVAEEGNRDTYVPPAYVPPAAEVSEELSVVVPVPSAPAEQEGLPPSSPRRSMLPFFKPEGFSLDSEEPGAPLQLKIDRRKSFP